MVVSILTSFILIRVFEKDDYGELVYFYALLGFVRLISNLGLGFTISRDIAAFDLDREKVSSIIYATGIVRLATIGITTGIVLLIIKITPQPHLENVLLCAVFASIVDFLSASLSGLRRNRFIIIMTMVQPFTYIAFSLTLIVLGRVSSINMMHGYTASFLVTMLVGSFLLLTSKMLRPFKAGDIQLSYLKKALIFTLPVYAITLSSQAWNTVIGGILGWNQMFTESAEFGVVFNLVTMAIALSGTMILTTFYPQASYLSSQQLWTKLIVYVRDMLNLVATIYVWLAVLLISFPETIIVTLFGEAYRVSAPYLATMATLPLILAILPVFTFSLVSLGHPWRALLGLGIQLGSLILSLLFVGDDLTLLTMSLVALFSSAAAMAVQGWSVITVVKSNVISARFLKIMALGAAATVVLHWVTPFLSISLSIQHFLLGAIYTLIYGMGIWFFIRGETRIEHISETTQ